MQKKLLIILAVNLWAGALFGQAPDTLWLADLDLSQMEIGWGEPHANRSIEGKTITINGRIFEHGVGTHAVSYYAINLDGEAERFKAMVGVDDDANQQRPSIQFLVHADRRQVFKSPILHFREAAFPVEVDLQGVKLLELMVEDGGDGIGWDHADWADAFILYRGVKPTARVTPKPEPYVLTPSPRPEPRINGARIYGGRPGRPFLYRIPATGERPMKFSASGLPAGLELDGNSGIISGKADAKGTYPVTLTAANRLGAATLLFKIVIGDQIALTPPLGWNSWNCFACAVDDRQVRSAAQALIASGLADHGWSYINIDDCWAIKPGDADPGLGGRERDSQGRIRTNAKFPDMRALTDYIHGLGLKTGIYSSPGPLTCAGYAASYQHEEQDALQFAEWGFDYLKYDWCSYGEIARQPSLEDYQKPYHVMRAALDRADRDIVFSLCQYGMGEVWKWGAEVGGNSWRTTGDIVDSWSSMSGIGFSQAGHEWHAGPGHWNDPDMLVVGYVGWGPNLHPTRLTADEQYTHITLWSLLASPLLIGCDLTRLDAFTLNLLTNDEVLAVNQDPLGVQASRVKQHGGVEVWVKKMEDGSLAVGLFNPNREKSVVSVDWNSLGISGGQTVRDLWRQKDLGVYRDRFSREVPAHGACLVLLRQI